MVASSTYNRSKRRPSVGTRCSYSFSRSASIASFESIAGGDPQGGKVYGRQAHTVGLPSLFITHLGGSHQAEHSISLDGDGGVKGHYDGVALPHRRDRSAGKPEFVNSHDQYRSNAKMMN